MSHALNVQAVCISNCCFLYFGVVAPGKCPDQKAFERTKLFQIVSNLRPGQYIVGDAAYTLTDQVLCPFCGSQRESTKKDAYNYFLSQLNIRIDICFGHQKVERGHFISPRTRNDGFSVTELD